MTRMQSVGRNERCPCGSGKKFKRCCETKTTGIDRRSRLLLFVLAGVIAVAILAGIASVARDGDDGGPRRVWSPEHGHYHTVQ